MRATAGGNPYAIGKPDKAAFRIRCIRFGKLAASIERRPDEQIRSVSIAITSGPRRAAPGG